MYFSVCCQHLIMFSGIITLVRDLNCVDIVKDFNPDRSLTGRITGRVCLH